MQMAGADKEMTRGGDGGSGAEAPDPGPGRRRQSGRPARPGRADEDV